MEENAHTCTVLRHPWQAHNLAPAANLTDMLCDTVQTATRGTDGPVSQDLPGCCTQARARAGQVSDPQPEEKKIP